MIAVPVFIRQRLWARGNFLQAPYDEKMFLLDLDIVIVALRLDCCTVLLMKLSLTADLTLKLLSYAQNTNEHKPLSPSGQSLSESKGFTQYCPIAPSMVCGVDGDRVDRVDGADEEIHQIPLRIACYHQQNAVS